MTGPMDLVATCSGPNPKTSKCYDYTDTRPRDWADALRHWVAQAKHGPASLRAQALQEIERIAEELSPAYHEEDVRP